MTVKVSFRTHDLTSAKNEHFVWIFLSFRSHVGRFARRDSGQDRREMVSVEACDMIEQPSNVRNDPARGNACLYEELSGRAHFPHAEAFMKTVRGRPEVRLIVDIV